ncbi:MAG: rhomboid family intramembrane serine protease [Planctomycetota bacterium]
MPIRRPAVIMWIVIALNATVFLFELTMPMEQLQQFAENYGLIPQQFMQAVRGPEQFTTLDAVPWVTHMFIHGGLAHLALNMVFFWVFADNIEDRMGHARFAVFYLVCGFAAAGSHLLLNPDSPVAMIGASGAVSGVLGAYLLIYPKARILVWFMPLLVIFFRWPAWVFLLVYLGMQIFMQLVDSSVADGGGGVAYLAHIGGFLAGMILCKPLIKYKRPKQVTQYGRLKKSAAEPPEPPF